MIIAIDQSTSATKAILFSDALEVLHRVNLDHGQFYPQSGWVEHDAEEIYANTLAGIKQLLETSNVSPASISSIAITNQRETAVVWDKTTGKPVTRAVVWQDLRGTEICGRLRSQGYTRKVREKTGLLIDPYFSASGIQWILDYIPGARSKAEKGELLAGTIDSWLIWKLTAGRVHATDFTNASRTLLFNIHTCDWDGEMLELFTIPRSMMPQPLPCDSLFGETDADGLFDTPIPIAGVIGDSHGALTGQMCFEAGYGKATYGTGSSVMMNIGEQYVPAPEGLVTSVGLAACGKVFYAFEGNIHCTGATLKWMVDELRLIDHAEETETLARSLPDNGGVYFVPAFAGLGAPWWNPDAKAILCGMSLGTGKAHVARAALEAIAYQVKDLVDGMTGQAGIRLKALRVDGGPTKNKFLMQFQADMLQADIECSPIEEASAMGAVVMNGLARGTWKNLEEVVRLRPAAQTITSRMEDQTREKLHAGWMQAVRMINR
ncbi:MAG: glycerol kinase GlpK [Rikenellaceae bacterium]|nr:glycerol kinase GlpK [Rikenellaceae bacterium]